MMGLGNVGGLGRLGYAAANSVGWWLSESQLDLDFANDRSFNRKTGYQASPNGLLTYTSPSPKMVYGANGVLRYAPHNLVTYSEDFSNAAWTKQNVTLSAGSPLGGVGSATLVVPTAVSGEHYLNNAVTCVSGRFYTFSRYVKAAGYNYVSMTIGASRAWATFDLTDGTVSATSSDGTDFSSQSATIQDVGNGWYKISVTALCLIGTSYSVLSVVSNTDMTATYTKTFTGDGVSGVLFAGSQVQTGVSIFDYLATTSAAKYDLPIDHDPLTGEALGVLIEEQRTNLLTYAEQFDNAAWLAANLVTMAAGTGTAPDGTSTADKVKPSGGSAIHAIYRASTTVVSGTTYALSLYAKADGYNYVALMYHDGAAAAGHETIQLFDLANGVVGSSYNTAPDSATIQNVGNGWYRCTITKSWATTSGNVSICPMNINANPRVSLFAGNTTSGIYVWGAQLEAGAFATSYIQTDSAQVTRAADQVTLAISAFNFSQTDGTWVASFSLNGYAVNYRVVSGGGAYRWMYGPSAITTFSAYNGSATIAKTITSPVNRSVKAASAYNASGRSLSVDGSTVATDTSPYGVAVSTAFIGQESGANLINGYIKRLTYFPTRKSNAELQVLSA